MRCSGSGPSLASPASCAATSPPRTSAIRPPAASSSLEILAAWPGVHALLVHRVAQRCTTPACRVVPRSLAYVSRALTGIEIHPAARVGEGLFIDHGTGRRDRRDGRDRRGRDALPGRHARRDRVRHRQAPPDARGQRHGGLRREAARADRRRARREDRRQQRRHHRRAPERDGGRQPRARRARRRTPCPRARTPTGSTCPIRSPTRSASCRRGSAELEARLAELAGEDAPAPGAAAAAGARPQPRRRLTAAGPAGAAAAAPQFDLLGAGFPPPLWCLMPTCRSNPHVAEEIILETHDLETAAAAEEKAKLKKHFGRFDMLFFLICTLVGARHARPVVASSGPQGFTWLLFLAVVLLHPVRAADVGARLDVHRGGRQLHLDEAGLRALRGVRQRGALLALQPGLDGRPALHHRGRDVERRSSATSARSGKYLFSLAVHLDRRLGRDPLVRHRQVDPDARRVDARSLLLGFFTLSVDRLRVQARRSTRPQLSKFKPSYTLFIALVPVLFFNFVGFELPSAAGDEMKNPQKDVPFTVHPLGVRLRAALRRPDPRDHLRPAGRPDHRPERLHRRDADRLHRLRRRVSADGGGDADRRRQGARRRRCARRSSSCCSPAARPGSWARTARRPSPAYDGAGPRVLGTFSAKYGTPIVVNFLSGVVATIVMVLAFQLSGGSADKYFNAVLNVVLLFTTISYIVIFPALIKLRYSHPHVHRPVQGSVRHDGRLDLRRPDDVLGGARLRGRAVPGPRRRARCSTTTRCRTASAAGRSSSSASSRWSSRC